MHPSKTDTVIFTAFFTSYCEKNGKQLGLKLSESYVPVLFHERFNFPNYCIASNSGGVRNVRHLMVGLKMEWSVCKCE